MSTTLYTNAHLLDPASGRDEPGGLLITDGIITDLGPGVSKESVGADTEVVDCGGHILAPGLIDMRVFTGEPGAEHRETLATASEAAAAGGITTIVCMPNTTPVIDDVALVDFIKQRARNSAIVNVHPMAALTIGLEGERMTEIGLLQEAGALAFTDGDRSVTNASVMRRSMAYATAFNALIVQHTEEPDLVGKGVMHEGEVSAHLGLPGIPAVAELVIIERDIRLVELTGARYHVSQVSSRAAVDILRTAKAKGLPVTCGVSANHLALDETAIGDYRTFFKVSPPLRTVEDRAALIEGVADGTIDVVVSGHDPQDPDTKRRPFAEAAFGAAGLETLLPVILSLSEAGHAPLMRLLEAATCRPANLLGLEAGQLKPGAPADLTLINPGDTWIVEPSALKSKSKNTPFEDQTFRGRAVRTVVGGQTVFERTPNE